MENICAFFISHLDITCLIAATIGVGAVTIREIVEEKLGERHARKIQERCENVG